MIRKPWPLLVALVAIGLRAVGVLAAEPAGGGAAGSTEFFEKKIRPVLVERCYECHGPDSEAEGDFRLDSLAGMLAGGARGPAIKPGDVKASLLIRAINHGDEVEMPPKEKLPAQQIADFTKWIAAGAHWPDAVVPANVAAAGEGARTFTVDERNFWAFRAPREPAIPAVKNTDWPRSPIDCFILAKLEANGLEPAPPADKRTLIRRLSFDLIGLPPSVEEVEAFVADTSPDAVAKVVDRLLASPRYGERWGRRWLDIARYADSNGMDENMAMAYAWRYRDWVIEAVGRDMPYDEFVRAQIAGDLLPRVDPQTDANRVVATGFLVLGPKMLAEDDPVKMEMDIVDEQVDTIGRAFMGLSLGCARCHDHKFDPIEMADYYSLAGIFKSTKTMENYKVVAMWSERPLGTPDQIARLAHNEQEMARVNAEIKTCNDSIAAPLQPVAGSGLGDHVLAVAEREREKKELEQLRQKLKSLQASHPNLPRAVAVSDREVQNLPIHLRGSHLSLGRVVPRRFPRILAGDDQQPISDQTSGRLELAEWLTQPDHPLTARVIVNRLWQGHFGEGLVRTVDNFGRLGERPDNQPLLDWLALRMVGSGWSMKAMHRMIVLSSAYRMSTAYNERAAAIDPENRLLWRMNRRRLEAEEIRDGLLAASGRLELSMGGTLLGSKNHTYVTSTASSNDVNYQSRRRSVYLPVVRSAVYDVFSAFDFADPSTSLGRRPATTVAPQALFMMNSPLMLGESRAMAELVLDRAREDVARVDMVYLRAYSRPPSDAELGRALRFVSAYQADLAGQNVKRDEARVRAWQALCRVVLASNEFVYVE